MKVKILSAAVLGLLSCQTMAADYFIKEGEVVDLSYYTTSMYIATSYDLRNTRIALLAGKLVDANGDLLDSEAISQLWKDKGLETLTNYVSPPVYVAPLPTQADVDGKQNGAIKLNTESVLLLNDNIHAVDGKVSTLQTHVVEAEQQVANSLDAKADKADLQSLTDRVTNQADATQRAIGSLELKADYHEQWINDAKKDAGNALTTANENKEAIADVNHRADSLVVRNSLQRKKINTLRNDQQEHQTAVNEHLDTLDNAYQALAKQVIENTGHVGSTPDVSGEFEHAHSNLGDAQNALSAIKNGIVSGTPAKPGAAPIVSGTTTTTTPSPVSVTSDIDFGGISYNFPAGLTGVSATNINSGLNDSVNRDNKLAAALTNEIANRARGMIGIDNKAESALTYARNSLTVSQQASKDVNNLGMEVKQLGSDTNKAIDQEAQERKDADNALSTHIDTKADQSTVESIRQDLTDVDNRKVEKNDFDQEVAERKQHEDALSGHIAANASVVDNIEKRVSTNEKTLTSLSNVAWNAETDAKIAKAGVIENKQSIEDNKSAIKKHESSIQDNARRIAVTEQHSTQAMSEASTALTKVNEAHDWASTAVSRVDKIEPQVKRNTDVLINHEGRIQTLESNVNSFADQVKEQGEQIVANDKKAMAGVASAMAMSSMHYTNDVSSVAVALGNYDSGSAIGMGYQYRFSDHAQANVQVSYDSNKKTGVSAGVAFGW